MRVSTPAMRAHFRLSTQLPVRQARGLAPEATNTAPSPELIEQRRQLIIAWRTATPPISVDECGVRLGISGAAVSTHIAVLRKQGRITTKGRVRNARSK